MGIFIVYLLRVIRTSIVFLKRETCKRSGNTSMLGSVRLPSDKSKQIKERIVMHCVTLPWSVRVTGKGRGSTTRPVHIALWFKPTC